MKKFAKTLVLATALVVSLNVGAGNTAEAAKKATVTKVTAVNKLTGSKTITLTKGKSATLKVTVKGKNLTKAAKKVTYKTSKKSVATVSSKGKITAKKKGSAKITVTSKYNKKKKATVKVKVVTAKVTKVAITPATLELKEGAQETLTATVTAGKGANKTLVWTSSNTKVAKVSSKGVVTAVAEGTAKITAKATDGSGKKATATVKVVKAEQATTQAPTTEQPTTQAPSTTEKKTVIAPKSAEAVEVKVTFDNTKDIQKDVNDLAKFTGVKKGETASVKVELDGTPYTATYDGENVKIGGKLISESANAKKATKVTVKADVKADKIASLVVFTPASVKSVTYGNVTFTEIKADSFKMGDKTYSYGVVGKNIVIKDDVAADFKALEKVATVTVEVVK